MKRRKPQRAALYETATYEGLVRRIGANVRRLRHARGWTQEECAFQCKKLGPALLRTIEAGRTNVTATTLARLCDGLGVDAAELFVPVPPSAKRAPAKPRVAKSGPPPERAEREPDASGGSAT
jgi:transcriptional regulator with XRE-family HTH domain